jgi:histidinol-phosphate/aromatic aminotransferase/cobyric acid decarboxylase-like protein
MKKLDMSWGSPAFLNAYWDITPIKTDDVKKPQSYQFGSRNNLKELILKLHENVGNANVKDKHVVIGAGATQIILGLLNVLKLKNSDLSIGKKITSAWAEPPHFSRFPILASFAGLDWKNEKNALNICTVPNNPDGLFSTYAKCHILDLTYMWPQYTDRLKRYNHPIMVFSLSKATGHASTRIGWAIIKDKDVAVALEQYIELSTSGLSIDAQIKAEKIIDSQLKKDFTVFDDGKKTLEWRWSVIERLKRNRCLPFKVLNNSGMFLWAEGECPENIIGFPGEALKGQKNQFRLNLGCSDETFAEFVRMFTSDT